MVWHTRNLKHKDTARKSKRRNGTILESQNHKGTIENISSFFIESNY